MTMDDAYYLHKKFFEAQFRVNGRRRYWKCYNLLMNSDKKQNLPWWAISIPASKIPIIVNRISSSRKRLHVGAQGHVCYGKKKTFTSSFQSSPFVTSSCEHDRGQLINIRLNEFHVNYSIEDLCNSMWRLSQRMQNRGCSPAIVSGLLLSGSKSVLRSWKTLKMSAYSNLTTHQEPYVPSPDLSWTRYASYCSSVRF